MRVKLHRLLRTLYGGALYDKNSVVAAVGAGTVETLATGDDKCYLIVAAQTWSYYAAVVEHGHRLALAFAEKHDKRRGKHEGYHQYRHKKCADDETFTFYAFEILARNHYTKAGFHCS